MSLCDKTDKELRELIDKAYQSGWKGCLRAILEETRAQLEERKDAKD